MSRLRSKQSFCLDALKGRQRSPSYYFHERQQPDRSNDFDSNLAKLCELFFSGIGLIKTSFPREQEFIFLRSLFLATNYPCLFQRVIYVFIYLFISVLAFYLFDRRYQFKDFKFFFRVFFF